MSMYAILTGDWSRHGPTDPRDAPPATAEDLSMRGE